MHGSVGKVVTWNLHPGLASIDAQGIDQRKMPTLRYFCEKFDVICLQDCHGNEFDIGFLQHAWSMFEHRGSFCEEKAGLLSFVSDNANDEVYQLFEIRTSSDYGTLQVAIGGGFCALHSRPGRCLGQCRPSDCSSHQSGCEHAEVIR